MKATFVFLAGFLLVFSTHGQGEVYFANTSSTRLSTNSCDCAITQRTGLLFNAVYRIGLYVASFGATDPNAFNLVAVATNSGVLLPGRFDGGFRSLPGISPGVPVSFEIRAWPMPSESYEGAQSILSAYVGRSAPGFFIATSGLQFPPFLMGEEYGAVAGFQLSPGCPVYSTNCPPRSTNSTVPLKISRTAVGAHTVSWTNTAYSHLLEWATTLNPPVQWNIVFSNVFNANGHLIYTSTNASARFYRLRRL